MQKAAGFFYQITRQVYRDKISVYVNRHPRASSNTQQDKRTSAGQNPKHERTWKNFMRTQKIRIITFVKYVRTFKYRQLPLENIYEHLSMDNLCVGISS